MYALRNMENIGWKDQNTNEYVFDLVREERKLLETALSRKKRWLGHILRGEILVKEVADGRMEERKRKATYYDARLHRSP